MLLTSGGLKWRGLLDDVAILVVGIVHVARVALIDLFNLGWHRGREAVVGIEAAEGGPVNHKSAGNLKREVSSCPG